MKDRSIRLANARPLAERICEAVANELGILDDPVLMAPSRRFMDAKALAAAALARHGLSSYVIADLLNYGDQGGCFNAIKRADVGKVDEILALVGAEVRK